MRHEEWHVTVEGDQHAWRGYCTALGIKPLRIELNTFEVQLMCAIPGQWFIDAFGHGMDHQACITTLCGMFEQRHFRVVRVKHELQVAAGEVLPAALYYECHIKLDGPFDPCALLASRDLFRTERWYITRRAMDPFDPAVYVAGAALGLRHFSSSPCAKVIGHEYEACVLDTNPALDARWVRN
jgi:hypothetical protein